MSSSSASVLAAVPAADAMSSARSAASAASPLAAGAPPKSPCGQSRCRGWVGMRGSGSGALGRTIAFAVVRRHPALVSVVGRCREQVLLTAVLVLHLLDTAVAGHWTQRTRQMCQQADEGVRAGGERGKRVSKRTRARGRVTGRRDGTGTYRPWSPGTACPRAGTAVACFPRPLACARTFVAQRAAARQRMRVSAEAAWRGARAAPSERTTTTSDTCTPGTRPPRQTVPVFRTPRPRRRTHRSGWSFARTRRARTHLLRREHASLLELGVLEDGRPLLRQAEQELRVGRHGGAPSARSQVRNVCCRDDSLSLSLAIRALVCGLLRNVQLQQTSSSSALFLCSTSSSYAQPPLPVSLLSLSLSLLHATSCG